MGFPDIGNFEIEFIEKTQTLIRNNRTKLSFTLLTNCLYSLLILTHEKTKDSNIPFYNNLIVDLQELDSVITKPDFTFNPFSQNGNPQPQTIKHFLQKIRHSLAHTTIIPANGTNSRGDTVWKTLTFKCQRNQHRPLELKATFNQKEMQLFALRISTSYQEHVLNI